MVDAEASVRVEGGGELAGALTLLLARSEGANVELVAVFGIGDSGMATMYHVSWSVRLFRTIEIFLLLESRSCGMSNIDDVLSSAAIGPFGCLAIKHADLANTVEESAVGTFFCTCPTILAMNELIADLWISEKAVGTLALGINVLSGILQGSPTVAVGL